MEIPPFAIRLGKYCASSTLAVLVDFSLLFLFVESFGIHYLFAATMSFIIGHSLNYFISRRWNFRKTTREYKIAYLLFVGFGILGLGLTVLLLKLFVSYLGVHYLTARIIVGVFVGFSNFLFNYYVTFKADLIPDDVSRLK